MNWIQALKAWNQKNGGKWCIPKKGTADYNEVKKLMTKKKGKGFWGDASKAFLGFNMEDIEKMDPKAVANLVTAYKKTQAKK